MTSLFLMVSVTLTAAALREHDMSVLRRNTVPYDEESTEAPYEDLDVDDEADRTTTTQSHHSTSAEEESNDDYDSEISEQPTLAVEYSLDQFDFVEPWAEPEPEILY